MHRRLGTAVAAALLSTLVACGGGGGGGGGTTYSISGTVSGAVANGVLVTLGGSASATATTAGGGLYGFSNLSDGSYTLTPSLPGYTFTPSSLSVTVNGGNLTGENFAAAASSTTYAISGTVSGAVANGVLLTLGGSASGTTVTAGGGLYSFSNLSDGSYTVTPSLTGFSFTPPSLSVTVNGGNVSSKNFTAAAVSGTYSISGTVSGAATSGVTVKLSGTSTGTTTTDSSGNYTFTSLANGSYTVTASGTGYVFGPPSLSVTVSGANVTGENLLAATLYDDFTSGLVATKWASGLRQGSLSGGGLVLAHSLQDLYANASYTTSFQPITSGEVTTWKAEVDLTQADYTLDTLDRVGIDLWFQPLADRLAGYDDMTNALFVRIALENSSSGPVARRQLFECTSADCSTSTSVGSVSGNWSGSTPPTIALNTTYTLTISLNTSSKVVTYGLSGGAYTGSAALAETINAASVTTPYAVDFSAANQYEARLFSQVRGGAVGGGNGATSAKFTNVYAGIGGAAATLFDSLSESSIDNTRWNHGIEDVQIASGGAQIQLGQSDLGYREGMDFTSDGSTQGMMAGVLVSAYSHTGGGRVQARLAGSLYNDGSNGSGTAPNTNGASSEVGDVIAIVSITGTDVSYAVVRCDSALCSQGGVTYIQDYTSLGTVTRGTEHTLAWWWDASAHTVHFQLDGKASVAFDPTVSNAYPVSSAAHIPFRQISDTAGDTKTSSFGSSSSGAITAVFSSVGTF